MTGKYDLRPYQEKAVAASMDALIDDRRSMLLTLPTGTGKTIMVGDMVKKFREVYNFKVLFLAHRRELIFQNYTKVRDYAGLEEFFEIDQEMGNSKFNPRASVVIGSVQTCSKENRLQGFTPDVIITDEAHCAQSPSYKRIYERFPDAIMIGITATPKRADKKTLYCYDLEGNRVQVADLDSGKARDAELHEVVFKHHIYDYPIAEAIDEGWLVNIRAFPVKTKVDISGVSVRKNTDGDRDFVARELNEALEKTDKIVANRINAAIAAWKEVASDRPTIVFCPSVKYAHWAAQLWKDAGYTSQAIDCETPAHERDDAIRKINSGEVQVTTNFGIYTNGTDVPKWSCAVMLRPINSWGLYCQCVGRITRPSEDIAHVLGKLPLATARKTLIDISDKPDCIVIDVVDVCSKHDLCTAPSILGLPCALDMEGKTITEAKSLIDRFDKVAKDVIEHCPASYSELQVKLQEADLLLGSRAQTVGMWSVAKDGSYRFTKCAPGFSAHLYRDDYPDGTEGWKLVVKDTKKNAILVEEQKPRRNGVLRDYFDSAVKRTASSIRKYRKENQTESAGTLTILSDRQTYRLRDCGYSYAEIDKMPIWLAKKTIGDIVAGKWKGRR